MSAGSHPRTSDILDAPRPRVQSASQDRSPAGDWKIWLLTVGAVLLIYLSLLNPYWVPGGDSELYIASARSIALGQGFKFNGQFVSISPPGWPMVLAAAMKISPEFAFLKLINIVCMTTAFAMWYWVLMRFTTRAMSCAIVLVCAVIQHVYSLTFWLHSDALFCLFSTGALLLALQINENRSGVRWRVLLLCTLCFAMCFVRWAGMLQWIMVAGALLQGVRPRLQELLDWKLRRAQWMAIALTLAVTAITFWSVRKVLELTPEEQLAAKDAGVVFDEQIVQPTVESKTVDLINMRVSRNETIVEQYIRRIRDAGKWFGWLLVPEMRFVGSVRAVSWIDSLFGWLLVFPTWVTLYWGIRRRQWVWLALAAYCFFLALNWPNANARYLVPVAPLVLLALLDGVRSIFGAQRPERATARSLQWGRRVAAGLLVLIACANLPLYAIDLRVARADDFYARYEDGLNRNLIDIAGHLNALGVRDREVAVSEVYTNLGKRRISHFAQRALVTLSDKVVRSVPGKFVIQTDSLDPAIVAPPKFASWARRERVRWYVYQQPTNPWRVWHFRLSPDTQHRLSREPVGPESAGWVLFKFVPSTGVNLPLPGRPGIVARPSRWQRVEFPPAPTLPTRVPGL